MSSYMGHFADLEGGYGSLDGYRKFLRDAPQDPGRPHPHEARARDDAKEVLGRHVSYMVAASTVVVVGCLLLYMAVDAIFRYAK
jgi:hypothetical protein